MFPYVDKQTKSNSLKFLFTAYFFYTVSICMKMVYNAEMAEIITAVGSTKSEVSLGLLYYYAAYFVAQLSFVFFIDKINLKWFFGITVILTALSFGMMLFANELWHLYVILGLNGFLQTPVWGGIMFYVGKYIPGEMSGFAAKFLPTGFALGTALTYGASALFILVLDWRYTFVFFSILSLVSLIIFLSSLRSIEKNLAHIAKEREAAHRREAEKPKALPKAEGKRVGILRIILFFTLIDVLLCAIYYAFVGWFPNLLIENFDMPTEYSILFTLLLPLTMVPSAFVIIGLKEHSKSAHTVPLVFISILMGTLMLLSFTYRINMVLTILISLIMLFCTRSLCSFFGTYTPLQYGKRIDIGKFTLIINAFAGLMGGVMPYAISFVLETAGWNVYFILLCILAAATLAMSVFAKVRELSIHHHFHPFHHFHHQNK